MGGWLLPKAKAGLSRYVIPAAGLWAKAWDLLVRPSIKVFAF
jgi:hypothetical protein